MLLSRSILTLVKFFIVLMNLSSISLSSIRATFLNMSTVLYDESDSHLKEFLSKLRRKVDIFMMLRCDLLADEVDVEDTESGDSVQERVRGVVPPHSSHLTRDIKTQSVLECDIPGAWTAGVSDPRSVCVQRVKGRKVCLNAVFNYLKLRIITSLLIFIFFSHYLV